MSGPVECAFCGSEFVVDKTRRNWRHIKFCSDACRKGSEAKKKRDKYKPKKSQEKHCAYCNNLFSPAPQIGNRQKFCCRNCLLASRRDADHEKWSVERRTKVCANCGEDFLPVKFAGGTQVFCSKGCQVAAIHKRHYGKFGRSNQYQQEFRIVRPVIMERDKRCVVCGSGDRLHVHHWDNSGQSQECNNSPDNLAVLCGDCHSAIHKVTLAKVDGEWCLDGKIFALLGLSGPIPVRDS